MDHGIETRRHAGKSNRLAPRSLVAALIHLLRQGLTPGKLALSVALGIGIGCFPIMGTATLLCAAVALIFRLNLAAIQVGNYLAWPLQFLLLIPFLRLGERVLHAEPLPLSPQQILAMAHHAPADMMHAFVLAQIHSTVAWLLVMPWATAILAFALRPLMRLLLARANRPTPALPD